jgi:heme/copper-type cytochrome/quinol oxidase subunit 2
MIKRRSLLTLVLLSIITCGIYGIIFWYSYSDDMNRICKGDGKDTKNYIIVILLSFITCGIYYWVWLYGVGNRLSENAPRYGTNFQENGTTILLWMIVGSMLCGIGSFVAMHIMIKNMNELGDRYNQMFYGNNAYQQNNQQPPYNN